MSFLERLFDLLDVLFSASLLFLSGGLAGLTVHCLATHQHSDGVGAMAAFSVIFGLMFLVTSRE